MNHPFPAQVLSPPRALSPHGPGSAHGGTTRSFDGSLASTQAGGGGSLMSVVEQRRADEALKHATNSQRVSVDDVLSCLPSSVPESNTLPSGELPPGLVLRRSKPGYTLNTIGSCQRRDGAMSIVHKEAPYVFKV